MTMKSIRCAILLAILTLAGCSSVKPQPDSESVEPHPEVIVVQPQPVAEPEVAVQILAPPRLPPVTVVLTNSQPAYADIAKELASRFDTLEVFDLSDDERAPAAQLRLIDDSESAAVVAIGLRAAQSSIAMSKKPVIFSQVFNYQDHDLLNDNSRGIAAVAPLNAQIAAWKKADPGISRIGAIVGPGHDELIAEAEIAASRQDVELQMHVTNSDQETLYVFKRMVREIDGFWLFPDNRVLSKRALSEIMAIAQRQQVAVLVPSESMLQLGASISISSLASDIAETITAVVRQVQAGNLSRVPKISSLSEIRVKTNDAIRVVDR